MSVLTQHFPYVCAKPNLNQFFLFVAVVTVFISIWSLYVCRHFQKPTLAHTLQSKGYGITCTSISFNGEVENSLIISFESAAVAWVCPRIFSDVSFPQISHSPALSWLCCLIKAKIQRYCSLTSVLLTLSMLSALHNPTRLQYCAILRFTSSYIMRVWMISKGGSDSYMAL